MKSIYKLVIALILFVSTLSYGQKTDFQEIKKPSAGKSLVYLIRSNGIGAALNFRVYDKENFIGKISSGTYIVYETNPGEHIFWAASENRDFVKANLNADQVYVIDVEGKMGMVLAAVNLNPLDPNNKKDQNKFYKVIKRHIELVYNPNSIDAEDKAENVSKAMTKYDELVKKNNNKIRSLSAEQTFQHANKPQKK